MQILYSEKPDRRIAVVSKDYALIFKAVDNPTAIKTVKKSFCAIELVLKNSIKEQGFATLYDHEIYGFIGLIEVEGLIFLGAITESKKVAAPIPKESVNKILSVDFFCLNDSTWDKFDLDSSGYPIFSDPSNSNSSFDQSGNNLLPKHPCFDLKKLLSNGSFFFSTNFDLTSTLQDRGFGAHSLSSDKYEEEYMWNSFLMQEIITYRDRLDTQAKQILDDQGFLTTVIRGFAETFVPHINGKKVAMSVICKQSWKRAGTRFNARGVDDDSHVANFVETEFIMYSPDICFAFTQIRGSIPVFWEQDTSLINPKVQLTRSIEATQPVFDKHFQRLISKYGPVHVVNLLSTKSSEIELSQRYKDHITRSKKLQLGSDVTYTWFDFHRETSQEGFSAVSRVIAKIKEPLLHEGYFAYDVREKKVIHEQTGVFRTNCLDCLDRTNLVQQVISLNAFRIFLQDFNLVDKRQISDESDIIIQHNTLWADHGDMISQIYTGTNALKSSFSRKGKMSFAGALSDATKSVSRMYINNFMDKGKQQNIDTLLGRLPHQIAVQLYDPVNEYITSELEKISEKFTSYSAINVFVGTYNVNGATREIDLSKWLFPIGEKFKPDIVVLGLQEVIELSAGSILNADYSKGSFWENMVSSCLNQYNDKYILLRVEQVSSMLILFFVKSEKAKYIKQVEGASKKTGFGGMAGNKGGVAIRFKFDKSSFCFVNMHLSAGVNNTDDRRSDYENIQRGILFSRSNTINNHDSIFWLGDTNYRLNLPNEEVRNQLNGRTEGYISRLLHYDQLIQEMKGGRIFKGFTEPEIKFRPTYKFDNGTDRYDSSEKARTPSWTDRIVYKGQNIQPLAYSDVSITASDHRPVFGAYKAKVKHIDEEVKRQLTQKLFEQYKQTHPDETSSLNFQLINLSLEDSQESLPSRSVSATGGSLLDFVNINDKDTLTERTTLDPSISKPLTASSSSSSLGSVPTSLLQPKRVTSEKSINQGSSLPNVTGSSTNISNRPILRPPPPPSFNPLSSMNRGSNSVTSLAGRPSPPPMASPVTNTPTRPSPPPVGQLPNNTNPTSAQPSTTQATKAFSPPPGFDASSILTPKNSPSVSSPKIGSTALNNQLPTNSSVSASPVSSVTSSKHTSATELNQDVATTGPAENKPVNNISINSWQPLTPK